MLNSWERKVPPFSRELQKLHGPVVLWNAMELMCDPWGVPGDMMSRT